MTPLALGASEAAQQDAEAGLASLDLDALETSGMTAGMLYNSLGGRGYVRSVGVIHGYFPEEQRNACLSGVVRCAPVDPRAAIDDYVANAHETMLEPY